MSTGPIKTIKFTVIPGQAGQLKLFPGGSSTNNEVLHTVLSELRIENGGEVQIEDGVELYVAESSTSCYLMVSGSIRYEV